MTKGSDEEASSAVPNGPASWLFLAATGLVVLLVGVALLRRRMVAARI